MAPCFPNIRLLRLWRKPKRSRSYEEMSKTPSLLDQLSNMRYAIYSGGPLSKAAGDAVRAKTRIQNYLGATEVGCLPQLEVDQEDYMYIAINPYYGAEFRHHSDDLYELFICRDKKIGDSPTNVPNLSRSPGILNGRPICEASDQTRPLASPGEGRKYHRLC